MPDDIPVAPAPSGPIQLSMRQRGALMLRALVGSMDVSPGSVGHTILRGINLGGLGLPPKRGTQQLLAAYSEMPWLRAVSSRVGSSFAAVEWRLFYARKPGAEKAYRHRRAQRADYANRIKLRQRMRDEGELNEVLQHPLLDALDSANAYHTGNQMRKVTAIHLDLVGDAFWAKERNGAGMPTAFWPIPPSWILSTPSPQYPYFRVSYRGWQDTIPDTDVLWFQDTDPLNPYGRGTGLGQSLGDELETDEYAARTTKQVFFNRARPDILVTAEGMQKADTERLEQEWIQKNQGFFRGFKPMFLNRKVEVHEFDYDFRQMQFVQVRQFERDTIMQVWGMPPEIMGVIENSNRATIDAADYLYSSKVIQPRCEFFRAIFQERLVPEYDDRLIIDYESPVAEDKEFVQRAMAGMPGAYRVNEHRELTGHEELPGAQGKGFLVPGTVSFKEKLEEADPLEMFGLGDPFGGPPKPGAPGGNDGPPKPDEEKPKPEEEQPEAKTYDLAFPLGRVRHVSPERRRVKGVYEDAAARIADRLEPQMRAAFLHAVDSVKGRVDMEALARAIDRNDVTAAHAAIGVEHFADALQGARGVMSAAFGQSGEAAVTILADHGIGLRFRMNSPTAVAWVLTRGASLVTQVTIETRNAIQAAVADAFAYGRPPRETAKSLLDLIGLTVRQTNAVDAFREDLVRQGLTDEAVARRAGKYATAQLRKRAMNIARTEIAFAQNGGTQEAWQQASDQGLLDADATRRVWIVTHDDRLDTDTCEPMDDQERGLNEPFRTPQGEEVMVPPVHPQCRCAVGLLIAAPTEATRIVSAVKKMGDELREEIRRPRERTLMRDADGRPTGVIER